MGGGEEAGRDPFSSVHRYFRMDAMPDFAAAEAGFF